MADPNQVYDEAIELQQADKLHEAVAKLEGVAESHPDFALAHSALAVFYGKLDRHEEAVREAAKVCELEPDDPFSFMAMSMICQKAGQIPAAEQAMSQAMEKQWAARKNA